MFGVAGVRTGLLFRQSRVFLLEGGGAVTIAQHLQPRTRGHLECRGRSLQAEVMRSVFGLCATCSTPKNEVMHWDSESRGFVRVFVAVASGGPSLGLKNASEGAAIPHI